MTNDTAAENRIIPLRDGRELCFAEYGDPTGTPLVFLHGTPASRLLGRLFDDAAKDVGVRVISPDRPGFGRSSPHHGRTFLDHADDVADLLDALSIDRAVVSGISGGGTYALACGVRIPERVERVLFLAGAIPMVRWADTRGAFLGNRLTYYVGGRWPRAMERVIRTSIGPEARPKGAVARRLEAAIGGLAATDQAIMARPEVSQLMAEMATEATRRGTDGLAQDTLLYSNPAGFEFADVRAPVRLLHGTADRNVPIALAHRVATDLPDCASRYYPGEGHLFVFDRTHEVLELAVLHDEVAPR